MGFLYVLVSLFLLVSSFRGELGVKVINAEAHAKRGWIVNAIEQCTGSLLPDVSVAIHGFSFLTRLVWYVATELLKMMLGYLTSG